MRVEGWGLRGEGWGVRIFLYRHTRNRGYLLYKTRDSCSSKKQLSNVFWNSLQEWHVYWFLVAGSFRLHLWLRRDFGFLACPPKPWRRRIPGCLIYVIFRLPAVGKICYILYAKKHLRTQGKYSMSEIDKTTEIKAVTVPSSSLEKEMKSSF